MEKYRYQEPENYEPRCRQMVDFYKTNYGSIPDWLLREDSRYYSKDPYQTHYSLIRRAVVKIINYFENKYSGRRINATAIPDVGRFRPAGQKTYSFTEFVLNRIHLNVQKIVFDDECKDNKNTLGCYNNAHKNLSLYNRPYQTANPLLAARYETEEDVITTLREETIIHELLHAISDDGMSTGFRWYDDNEFRNLNEGMTESLACDIAGTRSRHEVNCLDTYTQAPARDKSWSGNYWYKTQTHSAYTKQTSIMNLVRVASVRDAELSYLIGSDWNYDGDSINGPDKKGSWLARQINFVLSEAEKGDILPYQTLQARLIDDYCTNKLEPAITKIQSAKEPSDRDLRRIIEDVQIIGQSLCLSFNKYLDGKERAVIKSTNLRDSRTKLGIWIEKERIKNTPNVQAYLALLDKVIELGKYYRKPLNDSRDFYRISL